MKLLVPTDGSPGAMAALRFAARLAGCSSPAALTVIAFGKKADGAAIRELDRLGVQGEVRAFSPRAEEPIAEAIAREAERLKADLVIVGSEPRDGLREWVLGGLALRLMYVVQRPVAVIRPTQRRRSRAA
jgi:nucleotide-binding universal stress UspA family protein